MPILKHGSMKNISNIVLYINYQMKSVVLIIIRTKNIQTQMCINNLNKSFTYK